MVFKKKSLAKKFFKGFRRMHTSDRMMCITKGSPMSKPWSSSYYHSASDHSATYEQNFAVPFSACLLCCVHFLRELWLLVQLYLLAQVCVGSHSPASLHRRLQREGLRAPDTRQVRESFTSCLLTWNIWFQFWHPIIGTTLRTISCRSLTHASSYSRWQIVIIFVTTICVISLCQISWDLRGPTNIGRPHEHWEAQRTLGGPTNIGRTHKHWEAPRTLGGPTNIGRL